MADLEQRKGSPEGDEPTGFTDDQGNPLPEALDAHLRKIYGLDQPKPKAPEGVFQHVVPCNFGSIVLVLEFSSGNILPMLRELPLFPTKNEPIYNPENLIGKWNGSFPSGRQSEVSLFLEGEILKIKDQSGEVFFSWDFITDVCQINTQDQINPWQNASLEVVDQSNIIIRAYPDFLAVFSRSL